MKIIFLDIDGVLNNINHARMSGERKIDYDKRNIKNLIQIIEYTEAKIVLTSSHRIFFVNKESYNDLSFESPPFIINDGLGGLFGRLARFPSIRYALGKEDYTTVSNGVVYSLSSPYGYVIPNNNKQENKIVYGDFMNVVVGKTLIINDATRGMEIKDYIDNNSDIEEFVILDDEKHDFDKLFPGKFIKINPMSGLSVNDARLAIKMLNGE